MPHTMQNLRVIHSQRILTWGICSNLFSHFLQKFTNCVIGSTKGKPPIRFFYVKEYPAEYIPQLKEKNELESVCKSNKMEVCPRFPHLR